jgi:hypothetical protein
MKNIKLLAGILLIFSVFIFNSCDNEPVDPGLNVDDFNQSCKTPTNFQVSNFIDATSVLLSWVPQGNEATWTIEYGLIGFVKGTGTVIIADNPLTTVGGLNANYGYSFYLRANCGSNATSDWVGPITVAAMTNPNCPNPVALSGLRDATVPTIVNLSWTAGGTETQWQVQYGPAGFLLGQGTIAPPTISPNMIISGISTTSSYDFYVKANCSSSEFSNWVGPITIQSVESVECPIPTNLTAVRNTTTTTDVNLTWTSPTAITSWQIQYGVAGFTLGSGTIISSTTPTATISNIPDANSYDFYVRANCSSTENSGWIAEPASVSGNVVPSEFFANIDGNEFVENYINAGTILGSPNYISVFGVKSGSQFVGVLIDDTLPAGATYTMTGLSNSQVKGQYRLNNVNYDSTTGSVTIETKTATRIKGTFSFTASYSYTNSNGDVITFTHEVTDGSFDVNY